MTLTPIDRWSDAEPGFNREAADIVFKAMMDMSEDEALIFGRLLVADSVRHDLIVHRDEIGKALSEQFATRAAALQSTLAKAVVAKSRSGEDNTVEIEAMLEVSKAYGGDPYSRNAEGEFASRESRRFAESHARIGYDSDYKALHHKHAQQLGIPVPPTRLNPEDRARYQQAYRQVSDLIAPYKGSGNDALLHLHIENSAGHQRTNVIQVPARGTDLAVGDHLMRGDKIVSASVSVAPGPHAAGAMFDTLSSLGAPRVGATMAGMYQGGALDAQRVKQFGDQINAEPSPNEAHTPSHRVFRRIGAGSKLLQDSLGDAAPKKVQYALAVGNHIGTYGPEAQKVIGPTADRTAYRYRGTERAVDPRLGRAFESLRRDPTKTTAAEKREALVHGTDDDQGNWRPSGVLSYFGPKGPVLPKPELNTLQRKSGTIPPSQGIIIDARGRVAHQAVGYGDDWYLPFNLRNLKALKGGEYIRSRTFGGPTTEDLYTGLVSGAHSLTVASHNGVYTVEFDDNLRGGRRFNDKAARMVGRYGHLLDAVKEGQITTGGIHPTRLAELEAKVGYDPVEDPTEYRAELDKLKQRELLKPTLSQAQRNQAAVDFLNAEAENVPTRDGHVMNADEMVANFIDAQAGMAHRAHVAGARQLGVEPVRTIDHYRDEQAGRLHDENPEIAAGKVADALNKRPQFEAYMKRAEAENAAGLTPLRLDGQGYKLALDALQEQFPYYISRVDFHPWQDAHNATDTGYIKPRFNRPEAALAGYFDSSITGRSKDHADSTRYQNFPTARGALRPYKPAPKAEERKAESAAKPVSSETESELRTEADRALLRDILGQRQFAQGAAIPQANGVPATVEGLEPRATLADPNAPDNPIKALFTADPQALEARLNDPTQSVLLHRELQHAAAYIETNKLFNLDSGTLREFRSEGKIAPPKPLGESTGQILSGLADDVDFGKPAYDEKRAPSTSEVNEEYRTNGLVKTLIDEGKLPAEPGAADFTDRAAALRAELNQANAQNRRSEQLGMRGWEQVQRRTKRQAEGLARAAQLNRRHAQAVQREAVITTAPMPQPAAAVEGGTTQHILQMVAPPRQPGETDEEYAETLRLFHSVVPMNSDGGTFRDRNGLSYTGD